MLIRVPDSWLTPGYTTNRPAQDSNLYGILPLFLLLFQINEQLKCIYKILHLKDVFDFFLL